MKQALETNFGTIKFDLLGGRVQNQTTLGHRPSSTGIRGTGPGRRTQ